MSNAGQTQTQEAETKNAREKGDAPAKKDTREAKDTRRTSTGLKTMLITAVGGLLTGTVLVGFLSTTLSNADPELMAVPQAEIGNAAATLAPNGRTAYEEDAKSCKVPLAYVTLATSGPAALIRIKSGDYLSPTIQVTSSPQRIAIPYPAPYPTGHGQISIQGEAAKGALVSLFPTWRIGALHGAAVHNVVWTPKNPC